MASPLSESKLLAYSRDHLVYEVDMFFRVGGLVPDNAWATPESRALLESFLIHLRNLIDFLFLDQVGRPRTYDVLAEHFLESDKSWRQLRPPLPPDLNEARQRCHKQLSHLTTQRLTGDPHRKIGELMLKMRSILNAFVNSASPERLDTSVRQALPTENSLLARMGLVTSTSGQPIIRTVALGDTVNPRGPKGK